MIHATDNSSTTPLFQEDGIADRLYRMSVEEYHSFIKAGVLAEQTQTELLEGLVVEKMGKNGPHCVCLDLIRDFLLQMIPDGWSLRLQDPITLENSEPEPDAAIVRGASRDFVECHPGPNQIALLIEVSDTTIAIDRGFKQRIYAAARIPAYWVVDLHNRSVEVYSEPVRASGESGYRQSVTVLENDSLTVSISGTDIGQIQIAEILP